MKFSFPVIIKKRTAVDIGETVLIPRLGINKTLSDQDKTDISAKGLKCYLESLLLSILEEKKRNNHYIELPKMIDSLIDQFLNKNSQIELSPHDLILTVEVECPIKCTRRFFSTCLPPLMKLTILIEISAGMILSIGTLELTESGFIPMDADTTQVVTITQSALSTLLNLWIALSGPGMVFIRNFGVVLDDKLNKLCSNNPVMPSMIEEITEETLREEKPSTSTLTKIRLLQGLFLLLVLNSLWTGVTMDYQEMNLLNEQLEDMTNSLFPDWLISMASYTEFAFNQLNDPVMLFSLLSVGFKMISSYFTKASPGAVSQANHRDTLFPVRRPFISVVLGDDEAIAGAYRKLSVNGV